MSNFSAPFNVMVQNQYSHNILLLLVGQAVYCSRVPYASFLLKWTNRFPVFCSCKALFLLSFLLVSFLPDARLTGPCADWLIQYLRWLLQLNAGFLSMCFLLGLAYGTSLWVFCVIKFGTWLSTQCTCHDSWEGKTSVVTWPNTSFHVPLVPSTNGILCLWKTDRQLKSYKAL